MGYSVYSAYSGYSGFSTLETLGDASGHLNFHMDIQRLKSRDIQLLRHWEMPQTFEFPYGYSDIEISGYSGYSTLETMGDAPGHLNFHMDIQRLKSQDIRHIRDIRHIQLLRHWEMPQDI